MHYLADLISTMRQHMAKVHEIFRAFTHIDVLSNICKVGDIHIPPTSPDVTDL